ncbi:MAG: divalent-cation tolerance protein CutA [Promethearchaeota archaeon]
MTSKFVVVFVTVGDYTEAQSIARKLVEDSLAACVGMVRQSSIYRWKNEIVEDNEILLIIKTRQDHFHKLRDAVLSMHSYDVPEIISFEIEEGYEAYLNWITENVGIK